MRQTSTPAERFPGLSAITPSEGISFARHQSPGGGFSLGETDYRVQLNNYLQAHGRQRLSWEVLKEGPDHCPSWRATALGQSPNHQVYSHLTPAYSRLCGVRSWHRD